MTRAEPLPDSDAPTPAPTRAARPRRRRWPWVVLAVVLLVLVALGVVGYWLGSRVLTVRDDLQASRATIRQVQKGGDISDGLHTIAAHADSAVAASDDPLWRLAEGAPWIGDNLHAVRLASESLQVLTSELAIPALDALKQDDGTPMLGRLVPVLQTAAQRTPELRAELATLEDADLLDEVRSGIDQVTEVLDAAAPVLEIVPGMLGADGERQYLLVAQSNAETLPLGGSAASQSLIRVSPDGNVAIIAQADSGDFRKVAPDVRLDQSAIDLYGPALTIHFNNAPGRPDFPTAARLMTAFWARDIGDDRIDGVISVDPLALSRVLVATGPVTIPGWGEITSDNVVRVVLSEVYELQDQEVADEIFKVLAAKVFERVTAGGFDLTAMATAVQKGIDTGSIMFWSADEQLQQTIAPLRVGGVLPRSNQDETVIGVYFRDGSLGSKIDYYVKTKADVTATCSAGVTTFRVETTIHLDITEDAEAKLPYYVRGPNRDTSPYRTQVFVYGPPGTTVTDVQFEKPAWKWRPSDSEDLGRPVPSLMTHQGPGDAVTVAFEFQGDATDFGPLAVRTTPMVHPTRVTVQDGRCGG